MRVCACNGKCPGGLKEYWEIFERYPRLQGGFIWEWVDHGIKKYDSNGKAYYTYGGDYGDYPNSGAFCCDGLIQADRRPNAWYFTGEKSNGAGKIY